MIFVPDSRLLVQFAFEIAVLRRQNLRSAEKSTQLPKCMLVLKDATGTVLRGPLNYHHTHCARTCDGAL